MQVAFADIILLNKTDLVSEAEKQHVIRRMKVGAQTWRDERGTGGWTEVGLLSRGVKRRSST